MAVTDAAGPGPGTRIQGARRASPGCDVDIRRCVARGLSNAEIAAGQHLAEAAVKRYVARTLAELGLRDRLHVVVHGYEHGIVAPGGARG